MNRWRVGTLSMGFSLVLLGIILFLSQIKGVELFDVLIAWWPIIFILLGLEILFYLFFLRKEKPLIHYDIFSIFFVGCLCMLCIAFSLLTSTGLMKEVRHAVSAVEHTVDIPNVQVDISDQIKRAVVSTQHHALHIEKTAARELHLLGTYQSVSTPESELVPITREDISSIRTVGDTVYITIKSLPRKIGINSHYMRMNLTLVLPSDLQVVLQEGS